MANRWRDSLPVAFLLLSVYLALSCSTPAGKSPGSSAIPVDPAPPGPLASLFPTRPTVIHDNDDHRDVYTEEYLMALAHLGEIDLRAIITTYAANAREYELFVEGREQIRLDAQKSGLRNLPRFLAGTSQRLSMPPSRRIEDTQPLNLEASRLLVEVAMQSTPDRPLLFVTGGQLTVLADAWLLEPAIADRVVLSGVCGLSEIDYNAGLDAWAWTVILSKFRVFAVPIGPAGNRGVVYMKPPQVPKARIRDELPQDLPLFRWMLAKKHPSNELPDEHDYDGQSAIPLMRPDYITRFARYRPVGINDIGRPVLEADANGPLYEALDADQKVATEEFWRAMKTLAQDLKGG